MEAFSDGSISPGHSQFLFTDSFFSVALVTKWTTELIFLVFPHQKGNPVRAQIVFPTAASSLSETVPDI